MVGSCKYGNETSGSIKGEKCFDQLHDYSILKKTNVAHSKVADCVFQILTKDTHPK
jgi:hypothetical protein